MFQVLLSNINNHIQYEGFVGLELPEFMICYQIVIILFCFDILFALSEFASSIAISKK